MDKKLLEKPENYYNREMSWLQFNYRILNEAKDKSIPLFERLNFLSITESNLSEFFMVRVASLIDLVHADVKKKDIAGLTLLISFSIDQYCSGVQVNAMIAQRTKLGYPDSGHEKQFNDCGVTQCMHLPIGGFCV